ncbi:MAG: hypothetical protein AB1513_00485 [Pseudomonadota bacterium]
MERFSSAGSLLQYIGGMQHSNAGANRSLQMLDGLNVAFRSQEQTPRSNPVKNATLTFLPTP